MPDVHRSLSANSPHPEHPSSPFLLLQLLSGKGVGGVERLVFLQLSSFTRNPLSLVGFFCFYWCSDGKRMNTDNENRKEDKYEQDSFRTTAS